MELTPKDTKMMQGLSVMAMVCLHLFCRYDYHDLYQPICYLWGLPLPFYFGQMADFCVASFAFCSGYGHMKQYAEGKFSYKKRLVSILSLFINYWIILAVFSVVSVIAGQGAIMPGNVWAFLGNALGILNTYNGASWYLFTYGLIVVISPWVLKLTQKFSSVLMLAVTFVFYVIGYYLRFELVVENWLLMQLARLGMTLFEYIIGVVCVKHTVFTKIRSYADRIPYGVFCVVSVLTYAAMALFHAHVIGNVIIAPFTGFVVIVLFQLWRKPVWAEKLFLLMGEHSTNIWLVHMFFYAVLFEDFVYVAKYSPAIFAFMLAITLVVSKLINLIYLPINAKVVGLLDKKAV